MRSLAVRTAALSLTVLLVTGSFAFVRNDTATNAIYTGGPILTRLDVDATWNNVGANGQLKTYKPATAHGGHAIALVGYTKTHFIVRNSWGTDWADGGFAYATNAYAFAAFTEAYGVTV